MSWVTYVEAVGFTAPGLDTVEQLHLHFLGATAERPEDWSPSPDILPARQMRRLSESTRLAIKCAEQIADVLPKDAAWVFASSTGEGWTLNEIMKALCQPDIMIQPLRFQNSVHNAAQGQWSIAAGATGPGTSIAAFDNSVAAGLLKATMQAIIEGLPTGLVAFDAPLPPPLHEKRPVETSMAAAFAISPVATVRTLATLEISLTTTTGSLHDLDAPVGAWLMQSNNPVRAALPLLHQIICKETTPLILPISRRSSLKVTVRNA